MATGSVQLQSGQVLKEFNVTISEDAFLEARANFYAYLNSTILVGGGMYACTQASKYCSTMLVGGGMYACTQASKYCMHVSKQVSIVRMYPSK